MPQVDLMQVRFYDRVQGKTYAVGKALDEVTVKEIFRAAQAGDLCVESVKLDEQPGPPGAAPAPQVSAAPPPAAAASPARRRASTPEQL